jgi:hypothetical protein
MCGWCQLSEREHHFDNFQPNVMPAALKNCNGPRRQHPPQGDSRPDITSHLPCVSCQAHGALLPCQASTPRWKLMQAAVHPATVAGGICQVLLAPQLVQANTTAGHHPTQQSHNHTCHTCRQSQEKSTSRRRINTNAKKT